LKLQEIWISSDEDITIRIEFIDNHQFTITIV